MRQHSRLTASELEKVCIVTEAMMFFHVYLHRMRASCGVYLIVHRETRTNEPADTAGWQWCFVLLYTCMQLRMLCRNCFSRLCFLLLLLLLLRLQMLLPLQQLLLQQRSVVQLDFPRLYTHDFPRALALDRASHEDAHQHTNATPPRTNTSPHIHRCCPPATRIAT